MDILSLKRGVLPMLGYRINDGDGEGGRGDSNAGGRANGGNGPTGGGGGGGDGDRKSFNPAKDSQAANLGFGNEHDYGNWTGAGNSGSMTSWSDRNPVAAKVISAAASMFGASLLGKPGAIGAKVAAEKAMDSLGYSDEQKASAMAAIGNLGEDGFTNAVSSFAATGSFSPQGGSGGNGGGGASVAAGGIGGAAAAPPSISDLISDSFNSGAASKVADAAWSNWAGQQTALAEQANAIGTRGNAAYNTLNGMATAPNAELDQMRALVQKYGTQAYQDQNAGRAMADVQQQADNQQSQAQRAAMRMGVNPSSGRMMAMNNQNAIQTAAAKAGAAAMSRDADINRYTAGLGAVNTAANADRTQRMDLLSGANKLGTAGYTAGSDVAKLGLSFGTAASNAGTAATNAASTRIAANNGTLQLNNQQNQYNNNNDFWSNAGKAAGNQVVKAGVEWLTDSIF